MSNENTGADADFILRMENVTVRFPGVLALDNVHLDVRRGTVHALMGENGAGKSTLMKVLIGLYKPDSGTIYFNGKKLEIKTINDSLKAGISMIHQELSPIPDMTVAENIFLGREIMGGPFVKDKQIEQAAAKLFSDLNIEGIDPKQRMRGMSTAKMQLVEIAKAISYNADLIIMDEPTSAITEKEVEHLFRIIENLKKRNIAIIYITHKMDEVFQITDDITVFRDGQFIHSCASCELDKDSLIELMVGRDVGNVFVKAESNIGDTLLEVKDFSRKGEYQNINFEVRSGEIFGLAGLVGAGRSELMMSIFGATRPDRGEVYLDGRKLKIKSPKNAIQNRFAMLTEDRKLTGMFLVLDVEDNIVISSIDLFTKAGLLQGKKMSSVSEEEVEKYRIKTPSIHQKTQNLSGGNQQKVLVSRWMLTQPRVLIVDEPTRGIDVGAKAEIHKLISEFAAQGNAVIMISSELPEVMGMSDRIMVMHEGDQMAILEREDFTQERILAYAAGETQVS